MESSHRSTVVSNTAKSHAVILWKAIELLERQRKACAKDSRPKTIEGLKNNVSPLCKVIFFSDIAKTLRNVYVKWKGNILMRRTVMSEMSLASVTVNELLEKVSKSVVAMARKQRREVLMAQSYTEPFKSIHNQMKKWKKLYKSQTQSYGDLISALVNACIFKVDLANADSIIDLLKKSGVVDIDDEGKVKYVFPDNDALEAAVSKFELQYSSSWSKKIDVCNPNQHLLERSDREMETDDNLDELTVRVIAHLQKMKNHQPKTEKGLRNALAPMLSLMYVASPKSLLESLIDRSQAVSVRNPRKRSLRTYSYRSDSDVEKVVFKRRNEENCVRPVPLNHVIHDISSVLYEKKVNTLRQHKNFMPRASRVCETKEVSSQHKPGCYVLQELLEDVRKKAQRLNRRVIFLSSQDGPEVVSWERVTKWLEANTILPKGHVGLRGPTTEEKNTTEAPMEDDRVSADHRNISKESAEVNTTSMSGSTQAVNTCRSKPMSAAEMLASVQSLSSHTGDIDPVHVINMLTQAGYCTVHDNRVSYLDSFPTATYQESLKEMFTSIIQELNTSFVEGHVSKETKFPFAKTQVKEKQHKGPIMIPMKHFRKRPKYQ